MNMNTEMNVLNNSYLRIDTDRVRANVRTIIQSLPAGVKLIPVLKDDAYGMGMVGMGGQGGFGAAQNIYAAGVAQAQQDQQNQPAQQSVDAWKCSCGVTSTGKFCPECGAARPEANGWTCSCGTVNQGKFCQNCGNKKPEGC